MRAIRCPTKYPGLAGLSPSLVGLLSLAGTAAGGLWPGSAAAQLGQTPQAVAKVYGQPIRHNARVWQRQIIEGGALDGDLYQKKGLFLRVVYRQGKAELMEFNQLTTALTQAEVDALLAASAEESRWEMGKDSTETAKYFARVDGRAVAHWATGLDGSLLIVSENNSGLSNKLLQ